MRISSELTGVRFNLGGKNYVQASNGSWCDVSPSTGSEHRQGLLLQRPGGVTITAWPANTPPLVLTLQCQLFHLYPAPRLRLSPFSSFFRVASVPVRPSSFTVSGKMDDGSTFSVTSDADGKINGERVKGIIDYEFGLVELYFVKTAPIELRTVDLSHPEYPRRDTG